MPTRMNYPDFNNNAGKVLKVNPTETDVFWDNGGGGGGSTRDTRVYPINSMILTAPGATVTYAGLLGNGSSEPTEANVLSPFHDNVVVKAVYLHISENTCDEDVTLMIRKGGINTGKSVTIPSGTTGLFQILANESFSGGQNFSLALSCSGTASGQVKIGSPGAPGNGGINIIVDVDPSQTIATIFETSVTISSSDLLALHTTPVEVIAAPGAGKAIQLMDIVASLVYNSTPYEWATHSGGGNTYAIEFFSENASVTGNFPSSQGYVIAPFAPSLALSCGILSSTTDTISIPSIVSTNAPINDISKSSVVENDRMMLGSFGAVASPQMINGDSDLTLKIMYRVIDLP